MNRSVNGTWMRGGTSKCWVFHASELPADPCDRDAVLIRLFGSPDVRQIDGIGGATSTTSKVMVIDSFDPAAATVDYEFGQVSVDSARVEWVSNCGNCASAVALFAVQEGIARSGTPSTTVTMTNRNTGLVLTAIVDLPDAAASDEGGQHIPGVPYPGARVMLRWTPPSWSEYGSTLPTGNRTDVLEVDGRRLRVSLVDAGAPAVLVDAAGLGLDSVPTDRQRLDALVPLLIKIRLAAAKAMGLPGGTFESIPKVGLVGRPPVGSTADVEARMVSMTALHPAIGITSAIAVAAAGALDGTTVNDVLGRGAAAEAGTVPLSVGTLAGQTTVDLLRGTDGQLVGVDTLRSARRIADARVELAAGWTELRSGL